MTHTSTEQPEALRHAEVLESQRWPWADATAAELRRLHTENEQLREVLIDLIAGYEDTACDGAMDMMVIGKDVKKAARILGITQEKHG